MKRSWASSPLPGERAGCERSCRESFRPESCGFALGSRPSSSPSLPATFISSSSLALPVALYSVTTMSEAMPGWQGLSGGGSCSSSGARWPQPPSRQRGCGEGELPGTHDGTVRVTAPSRPRCDAETRLHTQGGSAGLRDFLPLVVTLQINLFAPPGIRLSQGQRRRMALGCDPPCHGADPRQGPASAPRPPAPLLPPPLFNLLQRIQPQTPQKGRFAGAGSAEIPLSSRLYCSVPQSGRAHLCQTPPERSRSGAQGPAHQAWGAGSAPPAHCLLPQPGIASDLSSSPRSSPRSSVRKSGS